MVTSTPGLDRNAMATRRSLGGRFSNSSTNRTVGTRQALDLVEHEQARLGVRFDGVGHHSHLLRGRRGRPGVMRGENTEIQPPLLERVGEIAPEHVRRIVVVE